MTELIIGGSGSGKSGFAETEALELFNMSRGDGGAAVYLATMINNSFEAMRKITAHRKNRRDKGFITVERSRDIGGYDLSGEGFGAGKSTVLLESVSNLVANEMFSQVDNRIISGDIYAVSDRVFTGIMKLSASFRNTVLVSDDVFRDGCGYDGFTDDYMICLGIIHKRIAEAADRVYEVAAGNAVRWKWNGNI